MDVECLHCARSFRRRVLRSYRLMGSLLQPLAYELRSGIRGLVIAMRLLLCKTFMSMVSLISAKADRTYRLQAILDPHGAYLLPSVILHLRSEFTRTGLARRRVNRWSFFNKLACACSSLTVSGPEHFPKEPSQRHNLTPGRLY